MATYHAIAATSQAILRVLEDACPRAEFGSARITFLPTLADEEPIREGITVSLYRVAANTSRRYQPSRPRPDIPSLLSSGTKLRPALNLDLYYLITPWATNADMQYRLLGWAMRTLDDTPILPASLLNSFKPEPATFLPDETVELIFDPISLSDMGVIWEQHKSKVGLSVTYIARMVAIDSTVEMLEARDVQTRWLELAKGPTP